MADAVIDPERRGRRFVLAGQQGTGGGLELPLDRRAIAIASDDPVRLRQDIDEAQPGMVGKARQRTVDMQRLAVAAIGNALPEGGQHDRTASSPQRLGQNRILGLCRGRAEIHVENDIGDAGLFGLRDQLGMDAARPGPDTDALDGDWIDLGQHDLPGRGPLDPVETAVEQRFAQRRMLARQGQQREDGGDQQMRSPGFQPGLSHAQARPRS